MPTVILRRMSGRDPAESHRAATPLELFYDLTFVVVALLLACSWAPEPVFAAGLVLVAAVVLRVLATSSALGDGRDGLVSATS